MSNIEELRAALDEAEATLQQALKATKQLAFLGATDILTKAGIDILTKAGIDPQEAAIYFDSLATDLRNKVRKPAKPKYRNTATGQTWAGRGRAPVWFSNKDLVEVL